MEAKEAWENLELKFKSGNDIPVRQAKITKEEYEAIKKENANSGYPLLGEVTYRYIAVFVDGDYKQIVYVEASSRKKAEAKLKKEGWGGWIRFTEITDDLQVLFNGR